MDFDCIVVGSGIAGLSFALKVASKGHRTAIITKKRSVDSNTNYAQGGIACVTSSSDDFEIHVKDTIEAGDGLCDESSVRSIINEGPHRIQELIDLGVGFTQLDDGRPSLGKEGGHSKRRILHVEDLTGAAIEKALVHAIESHPNTTMLEHHIAIDLITMTRLQPQGKLLLPHENRVMGIYVLDAKTGQVLTIHSHAIMLATGGAGRVYQYTTNPDIATGDGIAMAYRAGVPIANMEFIQFHPTAFYSDKASERFLISEAVRGEGGILKNDKDEAFMKRYHERADLAPRDIVARAIDQEMKASGNPNVWLDITFMNEEDIQKRFPNIYKTCISKGINPSKDYIPVVPAAHYICGGIVCSNGAETDMPGLFACGEAACTGLHGANRLASNSLLEAVVMAHRGADRVHEYISATNHNIPDIPDWQDGDVQDSDERVVLSHNLRELRHTMWDYVGIVRTSKRLERALTRISNLSKEINDYYWDFKIDLPLLELRNLVQTAELIVKCALQRNESRGLHYNTDHSEMLRNPANTVIQREDR